MTKAKWVRLVAGLFVLSLVVAACSSDDNGGGTTATTGGATGGATGSTAATGGGGGGGTTITIAGFAFDPDTITVSGPTEVTVTNQDTTTHTFTLDDGSVDETVEPGATVTVTVDVSAATGFHCNIHPQMTGQIEVS
jgi:plastocyanin